MAWPFTFIRSKPEAEDDAEPVYVRLASDEFLSGLVEIAEIYERREQEERERIIKVATELSRKEHFNHGDLDRMLGEMRDALCSATWHKSQSSEIRSWIQDYEHRGRRPPYMPPEPMQPEKPTGGE